jgi:ribosomal protein S27E
MAPDPLVCPTCGREHASDERFCEACGMPLVNPTGARDVLVPESGAEAAREALAWGEN